MLKKLALLALTVSALAGSLALAQPEAVKRTTLKEVDFPPGHTTHLMVVDVLANGVVPRHTHPGVEVGYVLEGEADMMIDGQPVQHVRPGDSFVIPANTPHSVKNGTRAAKVLSTFVVEKGKPLAAAAP